jgi:hypothetical protein
LHNSVIIVDQEVGTNPKPFQKISKHIFNINKKVHIDNKFSQLSLAKIQGGTKGGALRSYGSLGGRRSRDTRLLLLQPPQEPA